LKFGSGERVRHNGGWRSDQRDCFRLSLHYI
jgi:hypothetical protein